MCANRASLPFQIGRTSSVGRAVCGTKWVRNCARRIGYRSNGTVGYSIRKSGMKQIYHSTTSDRHGGTRTTATLAMVALVCAALGLLVIYVTTEISFLATL